MGVCDTRDMVNTLPYQIKIKRIRGIYIKRRKGTDWKGEFVLNEKGKR